MRTIYIDCASGISGDMMLGALIDAGADLDVIQRGVHSLGLDQCRLEVTEVKRHAFRAAKLTVHHPPEHAHRHLHHITEMIDGSQLTAQQQALAVRIFRCLGAAEAKVHGTSLEKVHFHEVGAVDSIADIVGCAIGFDLLAADRIVCAPVPTGQGFIQIAHGRCSVPAPATAEILQGVPLADSQVAAELTTPTGAALVKTLAAEFGPLPAMTIGRIGYGAGDHDFSEQANVLRLIVGESAPVTGRTADDHVIQLETNLDDVTPEVIGHCCDRLFEAGALDVYSTAILMKKGRPATKLTVLCDPHLVDTLEAILFQETCTLGIRRWRADRHKLPRQVEQRETPWGRVQGKLVVLPDGSSVFRPEFEDCRRLAREHQVAIEMILNAAGGSAGSESG